MTVPANILSKEEFVNMLDAIVAAHDTSVTISGIIRNSAKATNNDMVTDFFDPFVLYSGQLDALIKTLEVMFRDENGWIAWWLFDCDYGHDESLLSSAYDADGKSISLRTSGELYDRLLVDFMCQQEASDSE